MRGSEKSVVRLCQFKYQRWIFQWPRLFSFVRHRLPAYHADYADAGKLGRTGMKLSESLIIFLVLLCCDWLAVWMLHGSYCYTNEHKRKDLNNDRLLQIASVKWKIKDENGEKMIDSGRDESFQL